MKPSKWIGNKVVEIRKKEYDANTLTERPDYVRVIEAIVIYLDEQYESIKETP
mgnify:CR=1 FL=1